MNEILIIILLIFLNGLCNLFEIAFVSCRKSKLEEMAQKGAASARIVMNRLNHPERFISEIQIVITAISLITGAIGGIALASHFASFLTSIGFTGEYLNTISLIAVIAIIAYFSLVIGEIVPKTIALNNPEKIAIMLIPFMRVISAVVSPLAWFLSLSTNFILKLFQVKKNTDPPVSEEELRIIIRQGSEHGVLEEQESEIIQDVLTFSDKTAYSLMTPNKDVVWLDLEKTAEELLQEVIGSPFSRFPVCDGSIDQVKGIAYVKDMLKQVQKQGKLNLQEIMTPPFFIPETMKAIKLLEDFKKRKIKMGIVVNEYGETHGIVTIQDISDNVLGDIPDMMQDHQPQISKREDGSILVDGDFQFDEVMEYLEIKVSDEFKEIKQNITTVGGFIMYMLDKVPVEGDHILFENYRFEVIDMDANRVDKILIVKTDNPVT
ncbi:MAG: hemolysin family protein [Bacteroidales bacterium]|jgi:putative hemolysin